MPIIETKVGIFCILRTMQLNNIIKIWIKSHLVNDSNCNNRQRPNALTRSEKYILGLNLVLATLYKRVANWY